MNNCIFEVIPKEYILEFPFVNIALCFMPHHHIKILGNFMWTEYALNWEAWRGEKNTIFIHRWACVLRGGCGLGNHSFLEIWRQCTSGTEASKWLFTNPSEKTGFWQLEKGWTNKLNLHFRCVSMCEKWNMGADVKRDFSEWLVESVFLLGSPIHVKFLND